MTEKSRPTQVECPGCGTPVVLLPLKLYAGREDAPADIPDVVPHTTMAVFAIVDDAGCYTCPACQRQHRVEP